MGKSQKWNPIPYHVEDIFGEANAAEVAAALVIRSVYFTMDPMPDDVYRFTVKPEAKRWLLFYKAVNGGNKT